MWACAMNDFTKDELEDLIFCVKDHTNYQGDSIHNNLSEKLQAMIDNYCDNHDWERYGNTEITYCSKCNKFENRCDE
jgi:hypothetical protein